MSTGTPSGDVGCASGGLGSPAIPPTDPSLLDQLSDLARLNNAWRIVRRSAINSKSEKIVNFAKEFEQDSISNLRRLESSLREGSFVFEGVYGRLEERPGKSPRPLGVAPIASRIIQRAVLDILWRNKQIKKIVKNQELKNSFGGIQDESTKRAITELCKCINSGNNYYIASDIKDFFQKIPRAEVNKIIFGFLKDDTINSYIERAVQCEILNATSKQIQKYINLFPRGDIGVVQGCCLSPLYGNIYLHDFDSEMNAIKGIRCLRYIDDFIIIGKREGNVKKAFKKAISILKSKGLDAYTLEEKNTKAEFGDVRKVPINFLGCSVAKGQVRPRDKARVKLLEKIDKQIDDSIKKISSTQGSILIKETYINTIITINNIVKGWGGSFSFCNDRMFFKRLDEDIMKKIFSYHALYKNISNGIEKIQKRQRIFGLQMLTDCTDKDPIYGHDGILSQNDDDLEK